MFRYTHVLLSDSPYEPHRFTLDNCVKESDSQKDADIGGWTWHELIAFTRANARKI
jgi:hypothetical protein